MPRLHATALLTTLALVLSSCTGAGPDAESGAAAEQTADFDSVQTPPAASESTSVSERPADTGPATTNGVSRQEMAAGDPTTDPATEIVPQTETPEEPEPPRTTLVGAWEFVLCDFGSDMVGLLIKVETDGQISTATIEDDSRMMPGWTIQSTEITEKSAHIAFQSHDAGAVDFRGELQEDGIVRGSVTFGQEGLGLVRWLPSQRMSLNAADGRIPSENVDMMQDFQPSGENALAELREKARELGRSALAYELYRRLNGVFRGQRPDGQDYTGLPDEYVAAASRWGERVVTRANLDIAYTMAICGYSAAEAEAYWKLAEEQLGEDVSPAQKTRLTIANGFLLLQSGDDAEQQSGQAIIDQILAEDPYNVEVTRGLAGSHERNGQPEEALALYSELAALPTGAGDMSPVIRLWKELGRDPNEIEDHLNDVYKSRVHEFAEPQSDAPRATGTQHTVLGELFTGASCPPCVAADIATGGLEITYPKSDFIMLRYHEHIPAPDPLATAAGERRGGEYYQIRGTPALFFNGQPVQSVASMYGPFFNAPTGYADLRQLVDPLLAQSTEITIELSAVMDGGAIRVTAGVTGVDEIPESWKLRLCLAEDELRYPANNGVRLHEMVVRAMPGGPEGVAPANGKLEYDGSLTLEEVREEIREYVSRIPSLPAPPLEMAHLHVVAFVQDDAGRDILQATAVPVSGQEDAAN